MYLDLSGIIHLVFDPLSNFSCNEYHLFVVYLLGNYHYADFTALPAAGVVMESVVATVVANEILDKFSSDNLEELKEAVAHHRDYVKNF